MTRSSDREAQVTRYTTTTRTAVREAGPVSSAKRKGGNWERQTPAAPTGGGEPVEMPAACSPTKAKPRQGSVSSQHARCSPAHRP